MAKTSVKYNYAVYAVVLKIHFGCQKESNDQYSVGLIKDALPPNQDIFNHLQTLGFEKEHHWSYSKRQIWFNKCGEEFGKQLVGKTLTIYVGKVANGFCLNNICQQVQTKFNSYNLDNIPGVNASIFGNILANKYVVDVHLSNRTG